MTSSKPGSPLPDDSVEAFFADSWAVYTAILDHNYMFHDEIYGNVRRFMMERFQARPFSLLDLGCGNARHLATALSGVPVSRYVGYDLSAVALKEAAQNLAFLERPAELRQGDLLEALSTETASFDLIFTSFAVHHLKPDEKAEFFRRAAVRRRAGGALLMIDVVRDEDQDRASYLDAYAAWMASDWTALPGAALSEVEAHIRENDYPERQSELRRMAAEAGFADPAELPRHRFHRTLLWLDREPLGLESAA